MATNNIEAPKMISMEEVKMSPRENPEESRLGHGNEK
jgi:hypothetical protein